MQIDYFVNVRVSSTFEIQRLFHVGNWQARVSGVELLGMLRAENTLLIVLLAFVAHRMLKRVGDRSRIHVGVVLFALGTMVLAVGDNACC